MRINYRPEIDGLRAIAVISVIFYHAHITIFETKLFKGGFIGVDIFFIISGYLITAIILKELILSGSFSFKHFYERRIRRIIPVLLFVIFVCLPFAWIYLLPNSFIDFSKSILYSLGFSSNFYFWQTGQQYATESGLLKPFLHTWSLSVEEQYYIFFPIFLLITFKYFKKYLLKTMLVGLVTSLLIADWGSRNYPSATFYFLHSRMWELIAGSLLAYFEIFCEYKSKNKILNNTLSGIGFFLIIFSILFGKTYFRHPSFYTLAPVLGTCLIIFFCDKEEFVTKILSSKLLVGIGFISYSLYLWHYPIFAFARINELDPGNIFNFFALIILIFLFSILTYFYIEKPSRNKKYQFKIIFLSIFFSLLILVVLNSLVVIKEGFKSRMPDILQNFNFKINPWRLLQNDKQDICHTNIDGCIFNITSEKKIFMIGDSHSASLVFNLKDRVVKKNYQFITSTFDTCFYFVGFDLISTKTQKIDKKCNNNYFSELEKKLKKQNNSIIIFSGRLALYLNNSRFDNKEGGVEIGDWHYAYNSLGRFKTIQSSFRNSINVLSQNNQIILIYPIPEVGFNIVNKIQIATPKNIFLRKNYDFENYLVPKNYITTSYQVYNDRAKSSFELLDSIKGKNVYKVYPHKLFCNALIKGRCMTHDNKNIYYWDDDHLSVEGSKLVNDLIIQEIDKIEKKPN